MSRATKNLTFCLNLWIILTKKWCKKCDKFSSNDFWYRYYCQNYFLRPNVHYRPCLAPLRGLLLKITSNIPTIQTPVKVSPPCYLRGIEISKNSNNEGWRNFNIKGGDEKKEGVVERVFRFIDSCRFFQTFELIELFMPNKIGVRLELPSQNIYAKLIFARSSLFWSHIKRVNAKTFFLFHNSYKT